MIDPGELQRLTALPQEGADVDRHRRGARRQSGGGQFGVLERTVELPAVPPGRLGTGKHDAGARVPAQQLARFLGVVSEEEVLHRVLLAGGAPGKVRIDPNSAGRAAGRLPGAAASLLGGGAPA